MTELLSYQPDNLLPGQMFLRKWSLQSELMWYDGSSYSTLNPQAIYWSLQSIF